MRIVLIKNSSCSVKSGIIKIFDIRKITKTANIKQFFLLMIGKQIFLGYRIFKNISIKTIISKDKKIYRESNWTL